MIIPSIVTSVTKNSVKAEYAIIVICLVGLEVLFMKFCNLNYLVPTFFTVVFHNLSGYDSHLFIRALGNSEGDISCKQNNEKNYISFTKQVIDDKFVNKEGMKVNVKRELRFVDSLRFMAPSLDKLSSDLKIDQFVNLKKYYSGNQLSLLLRKGVYPYDYINSV